MFCENGIHNTRDVHKISIENKNITEESERENEGEKKKKRRKREGKEKGPLRIERADANGNAGTMIHLAWKELVIHR